MKKHPNNYPLIYKQLVVKYYNRKKDTIKSILDI